MVAEYPDSDWGRKHIDAHIAEHNALPLLLEIRDAAQTVTRLCVSEGQEGRLVYMVDHTDMERLQAALARSCGADPAKRGPRLRR